MKKSFLALGLLAAFGAAQAVPLLTVVGASPVTFSHYSSLVPTPGGTALIAQTGILVGGDTGTLTLSGGPRDVTFTYLGSNAGDKNEFTFNVANHFLSKGSSVATIGDSVTAEALNGAIDFSFTDLYRHVGNSSTPYKSAVNGSNFANIAFRAPTSVGVGVYDFFVSFNDFGAGDHDFNDMVVGVSVSPIPEPETYALMLAGLGAMGFVARRRKQAGA